MRMGMINIGIWELVVVEFQMEQYQRGKWVVWTIDNQTNQATQLRFTACSAQFAKCKFRCVCCVYDMGKSSWFFLLF